MADEPEKRTADGKFKPGVSPNPGGRPKLLREFQELLAAECFKPAVEVLKAGLKSASEKHQEWAADTVFDRLFGKVPQALTGVDGERLIPGGEELLEALRRVAERPKGEK